MPKAEGGLPISRPIWSLAADPPLCHSVTSPPKETFESVPFAPLAGEMPKAEGGLPISRPIWSLAADPPLCHSVTSPPARGERGERWDLRVMLPSSGRLGL